MSDEIVEIGSVVSGVPGLDDILGGGLPELSFIVIAGGPGSGKTTLAHQIMFGVATPERPALYVSILGEPPIKMLRFQQQYSFFDPSKVGGGGGITFLHLGDVLLKHGLEGVLARIIAEVEASNPTFVIVDSFRSAAHKSHEPGEMAIQNFVQQLALHLTSWEATTFLIGEFERGEAESNPLFTVADGVIWLTQETSRNSIVRKVEVRKLRGRAQIPGLHTMKMSKAGLRIYPRLPNPDPPKRAIDRSVRRTTGIAGLDDLIGGGIPSGYSVMIVGPSGSGKTILSTQFIREGIDRGEPGVIAVFEKRPEEYLTTAPNGDQLNRFIEAGMLRMLYLRPLDLSVDETMEAIAEAVDALGAKRVVIDSLSGFEVALAPSFREDFRESAYRMVGGLVGLGVSIVMTAEIVESYTELRLSPHEISFLTDGIIVQRYIEMAGTLRKMMFVAKMRGMNHRCDMRLYDIQDGGIVLGDGLTEYEGLLVGTARRTTLSSSDA